MGTLLQVVFDIFAALGFFVILMRMNRAPKDDPRLSRGLQLLQSKISVLEDLSDRTETQVNQLGALLDQKSKEVQAKIQLAESHVHEIRVSMQNSLEVAKIFQDKIPHQEIIERQNSIKYVQAARMAHQGIAVDEIAAKVDLPKGEIEFISKVNREQLMFNEEHLPPWAKEAMSETSAGASPAASVASASGHAGVSSTFETGPIGDVQAGPLAHLGFNEAEHLASGHGMSPATSYSDSENDQSARLRAEMEIAERQRLVENLSRLQFEMQNLDLQLAREAGARDLSVAFESPRVDTNSLQKIGEEFRKAVDEANAIAQASESTAPALFPPLEQLTSLIREKVVAATPLHRPQAHLVAAPVAQVPAQAPMSQPVAPTVAQPANFSTSASYVSSMSSAAGRDPVLSRATTQSRAQATLKANPSSELAAARQLAKDVSPAAIPASSPVINGRSAQNGQTPVIRKVQFPKIESPEG